LFSFSFYHALSMPLIGLCHALSIHKFSISL
jgi:hypothetical protein